MGKVIKRGNASTRIATAEEKTTSINPTSPLRWNTGITRNSENTFVFSLHPLQEFQPFKHFQLHWKLRGFWTKSYFYFLLNCFNFHFSHEKQYFLKKAGTFSRIIFVAEKTLISQNARYNYLSEGKERRGRGRRKEGKSKKLWEMWKIFISFEL